MSLYKDDRQTAFCEEKKSDECSPKTIKFAIPPRKVLVNLTLDFVVTTAIGKQLSAKKSHQFSPITIKFTILSKKVLANLTFEFVQGRSANSFQQRRKFEINAYQ